MDEGAIRVLHITLYLPDGTPPQAVQPQQWARSPNTRLNRSLKPSLSGHVPKKLISWLMRFNAGYETGLKKSLRFRQFPESLKFY
jgi:hypothetical protein